ncbi:MAG TPA: DUF2491 family protein [Gammaproteobacteria bacterium]|nr:DUF2491 family protein [Gammaproteobacteria bacterium]
MFSFFKNKETEKAKPVMPEVLGFRLGGAVELNELKLRLIDDCTTFENVTKMQSIQAVGVVKLDEHSTIVRYYTDDDGFFQVIFNGGMTESHIEDLKLWFFYDTQGVSGDAEWNKQLKNGISKPDHELEGQQFYRVWNEVSGDSPPVSMTETTTSSGSSESTTDQFVMLYERESKPDFFEFLMISGEEKIIDDQAERCIVISTGINLSSADFEVIG